MEGVPKTQCTRYVSNLKFQCMRPCPIHITNLCASGFPPSVSGTWNLEQTICKLHRRANNHPIREFGQENVASIRGTAKANASLAKTTRLATRVSTPHVTLDLSRPWSIFPGRPTRPLPVYTALYRSWLSITWALPVCYQTGLVSPATDAHHQNLPSMFFESGQWAIHRVVGLVNRPRLNSFPIKYKSYPTS